MKVSIASFATLMVATCQAASTEWGYNGGYGRPAPQQNYYGASRGPSPSSFNRDPYGRSSYGQPQSGYGRPRMPVQPQRPAYNPRPAPYNRDPYQQRMPSDPYGRRSNNYRGGF